MNKFKTTICFVAILCSVLPACAVDTQNEVGRKAQKGATFDPVTLWSNTEISTCFARGSVASSDYEDAKTLVREALAATWEAASGVQFKYDEAVDGDCPIFPDQSWLILVLEAGTGGVCNHGEGANCTIRIDHRGMIQSVAVHEVGHALGLAHEHSRDLDILCSNEEAKLSACQECLANEPCRSDEPNVCSCSATSYNLCINPDPSVTSTTTLTDTDIKKAENVIWNIAGGEMNLLTEYDINSIMNYCNNVNDGAGGTRVTSATDPSKTDWRLTELDALAAEILYPKDDSTGIACGEGCFLLGDGSLVARKDGTLVSDWEKRGAIGLTDLTWPGSYTGSEYPLSELPDGWSVWLTVTNPLDDTHTGETAQVTQDDSYHAAITSVVL